MSRPTGNTSRQIRKLKGSLFKKKSAMSVANRALKMASRNEVLSHKTFTLASTNMTASKVPTVKYLQPSNGLGESAVIKRILGNIYIKSNTASNAVDDWRVDIVLDRTPARLTLSLADVYGSATPKITIPINFNTRDRYKIVRSWTGSFNDQSGTTSRHIRLNFNSGLKAVSNTAVFSQANIEKNAYYLVFWTSATSNTPIIEHDGYVISIG